MSLPSILLNTDKTTPVYELPLKIRQGDKGDVLNVVLGKDFKAYSNLLETPVVLMAERDDQTLVKVTIDKKDKVDNTFSVTFPDAMYTRVGVFRRVYFKIGDDSTSDIKIEVLSGTGSRSSSGNYIQDFEDLLQQAMSYVYALNSLSGTYDGVIDRKVEDLTQKMTEFVTKAGGDLEKAKTAWNEFQTKADTDAKTQRDGFDTEFNKLISDDKATFKTISDEFHTTVDTAKSQNTANQTTFENAESKRASDFKTQSDGFSTSATNQRSGFDTTFKKFITDNQTSVDAVKSDLTSAISAGTKQNSDNQTAFNSAQTKRATDFTNSQKANATAFADAQDKRTSDFNSQKAGFETDFGKQKTDFENRFKALLTTLQGDFDDFKDLINKDVADFNTSLDSLDAQATDVKNKYDALKAQLDLAAQNISGVRTNLLINTSDFSSNWHGHFSVSTTTEYNGYPSMVVNSSVQDLASQKLSLGKLQNSTQYTASFWAKADNAGDKAHTELEGGIGNTDFVLTTNWVRYTAVLTSRSDAKTNDSHSYYFLGVPAGNTGNVYIALPKLELGSNATDYSLNPEDIATNDGVQTSIKNALANYSTTAEVDSKISTGVGQAKTYAEQSIKDIIGAAPATLDTIGELADAVTKNKDGVQAINEGITKKADKTDVTALQNTVQTMITSISQADYDKLVSAGTVNPKIMYVIPDA